MNPPPGSIEVRRESASTVFVRMAGYIPGALVSRYRPEFFRVLGERSTPYWMFDLLDLSGFDAAAVSSGSDWWRAFKAQQGSHVLFVTSFSAARMTASALGFSVGVKITICSSMREARASLARISGGAPLP
ncbi:MAG: hypothetical protein MUF64_11510 [Polyangiaceae bacterium]|jgi:hypothetical protein|nr:hypothetical protein [Polyangiaceae bacterium]